MFAKERLDRIVQILHKEGKVIVKDLSKEFNVTEDAIRKDLKYLENQGTLERTYGGGILKKQIAQYIRLEERNKYDTDGKLKIAKKAFSLLKNGETIFLDISSTNMMLAEMIANSSIDLTVITNSVDILKILSVNGQIQIISPGGIFYQSIGGFVGSAAIEAISRYTVQKAFIGSCGVDIKSGSVTTFNVEDGNTKKAIIQSCKEAILVMERKKFFYDGIYKFADIRDVDVLITDEEPPVDIAEKLKEHHVKIV